MTLFSKTALTCQDDETFRDWGVWRQGVGPANCGKSLILTLNAFCCTGLGIPGAFGAVRAPLEPMVDLQVRINCLSQ